MENKKPAANQPQQPVQPQQPIIVQQAPKPEPKPVDPGDNRNAPGTYPKSNPPPLSAGPNIVSNNDPKAPRKADPLNQAISVEEAEENNGWIDLEDEAGGTGTMIFSGFLTNVDYNPDWTGLNRIRLIDEMRSSDATIQLGLSAVKYPILSANWYIKPGADEKDAGENGKKTMFTKQELFQNPNFSFLHILRQALLYCEYGQMLFEKVWRKRVDGQIGWKKFAPRMPNTIFRYSMSDGITPGITQILPNAGSVDIPMWKLMVMVLDMEGANYEGRSLLRSAYQHWFYKKVYYKIDAIAAERQGMGVPIVYYPSQASPADKAAAQVFVQNLRVNEQSYGGLPEGFRVEWLDTKGKGLKDVEKMVEHHDKRELMAFRAQFLSLGTTSAGSEHASNDQTEMFYLSLNYIARIFQEAINEAIRELIDLNFSDIKSNDYPTLEFANLGNFNMMEYARSLLYLGQGGYITPDDDLERHIREALKLPEAMKFSDEDYLNPRQGKINIPQLNVVPPDGTTTDPTTGQPVMNVKSRPPVKYLNSERLLQQQEMQYNEELKSLRELHMRIQEAIEKKKPVV